MNTTGKTLIILRGLPGSGKSTFAQFFEEKVNKASAFEADQYINYSKEWTIDKAKEAHRLCREDAEEEMKQGVSTIIVSNTSTQEWEMEPYEQMAEKYGYRVFHLIVENRHNGVSEHQVPASTLLKMKKRFSVKL